MSNFRYQYTFDEYIKLKEFEQQLKADGQGALILVDRKAYDVVRFFDVRIMNIFYEKYKPELVSLLSDFLVGSVEFSEYHTKLVNFTRKPFSEWQEAENDLDQLRKFEDQISTASLHNTIEELIDLCEVEKFTVLDMAAEGGYLDSVDPCDWLTVSEIKENVNQIRNYLIKEQI